MLASLLLFAAADAAIPKPGPIKAFGDWAVACDNVHACEMTSLIPESEAADGSDSGAFFSIARAAGPGGGFTFEASSNGGVAGAVSVQVDGSTVASGSVGNDLMSLSGEPALRIVAAMANGKRLALVDAGGKEVAHASLAGSSAALRFIDADQGRAGTVTAAVARGPRPASAVPPPPPLPHVPSLAGAGVAATVTPALRKAMIAASECDAADVGTDRLEGNALGGGKTLVLLPCGAGAYNFSSIAFIVSGGRAVLARFDSPPGWSGVEDGKPMLVNAEWDAKTSQLSSYAKGRGLGDCGSAERYVWDGTMFRLVEATQMGECRGSVNWLTIWRAAR